MTDPRSKKEKEAGELSVTAKKAVVTAFTEARTGKQKDIDNKYIRKGNAVEEDSITLLSLHFARYFQKNEKQFENQFLTGTPDIITDDAVWDVKSSWDEFTFDTARFVDQVKPAYYGQLQGYMELKKKKVAYLAYCLIDTPESEIEKQVYYWRKDNPLASMEDEQAYTDTMRFDYPASERIAVFKIKHDPAYIKKLYDRMPAVREYAGALETMKSKSITE